LGEPKKMLESLSNINSFVGMDFCTFKLKESASEAKMLDAAKSMEQEFLSKEPGFLGHGVLKGKDGTYVDLAFATTQSKAESICGKWMENEFALKYLEFIDSESVDLSFWERIK
jgi:hypothetical protein